MYKFLVAVSNLGHILFFFGPRKGTEGDNVILTKSGFMSTLKKTDIFLGDCAFADPQILKPETITQWWQHKTRDARYEAAWRNEKLGFLRSRVEHTFGKMMLGRWGVLNDWKWDDRKFLYEAFAACCFVVEAETTVDHGGLGGDRYETLFDPVEATIATETCPSFRGRYGKIISKAKENAKEAREKAKEKAKAKASVPKGVTKKRPMEAQPKPKVSTKDPRRSLEHVVGSIKRRNDSKK